VIWDTEVLGLRTLINADNVQVIRHQNEHRCQMTAKHG